MSEDAGDGTIKVEKLREAASIFVQAMLPGDAIGVVRFDDTADRLMDITDVGPLGGTGGRATAVTHITSNALNPDGATSIGAGVNQGTSTLNDGADSSYSVRAMVVLTDGVENTPPMLSSVMSSITANTYAIGLGLPANISVDALDTLTKDNAGYLLVTGELNTDQRTRLTKYFLQVLAGVTNAEIVTDPSGALPPGVTHRVPFQVTEADYGLDVFVLTPLPQLMLVALEAPDGTIVDGNVLNAEGTGEYIVKPGLWLYRFALPAIPSRPGGTHRGRWNVLLRQQRHGRYRSEYGGSYATGALPYDVIVHAYSSLEMLAWLNQNTYKPGARVALRARVMEYTRPLVQGVSAWADVTAPDGVTSGVALTATADGSFEGRFTAPVPGVYQARIRSQGTTTEGSPFTRELTLTAVVRTRGATPPSGDPDSDDRLCELLHCLARHSKLLDADALHKCCRKTNPAADHERERAKAARWR